jgi:hypothetical protein
MIVPADGFDKKKKRPEFVYKLGPVQNTNTEWLKEESFIVFNYLRIVSIPVKHLANPKHKLAPIFGLSGACLARIQTLYGGHAIRQGVFE